LREGKISQLIGEEPSVLPEEKLEAGDLHRRVRLQGRRKPEENGENENNGGQEAPMIRGLEKKVYSTRSALPERKKIEKAKKKDK